jgi:serine/threonine-protein kinase
MGIVYAAEDTRLGRRVALKAVSPEFGRDSAGRERLRREARAAAVLTHPGIATVYALEEAGDELYLVSELVEGHTLRDELKSGPLSADRLRSTLLDVADALAAAHTHGIVHRDLKPDNIIRAPNGHVKILDFGLAREIRSPEATMTQLTQAGAAVGTPGYMAPEQLSGGTVDARTDIFAFGVLATELATGEHPFGPDSAAMLRRMTQLLEGRPLSTPAAWAGAPDLAAVARRCMRADPAERYASGIELAAALRGTTSAVGDALPHDRALWWWQFHQAAVAVALAAMPVLAWLMRGTLGRPNGSRLFFAALVLATISISARLNLVFTARVHPRNLQAQRARIFPWVAYIDAALALLLMVTAALLPGDMDAVAGFAMSLGTVILASLVLIEPATARAALE